jgi:hypothetical protein
MSDVSGEIPHLRLMKPEQLGDGRRLVFQLSMPIIRPISPEKLNLDITVTHGFFSD